MQQNKHNYRELFLYKYLSKSGLLLVYGSLRSIDLNVGVVQIM